jgi:hypothetical protein
LLSARFGVIISNIIKQRKINMSSSILPHGSAPAPLPLPHFPDALHAVVWRNWELVEIDRLAQTLRATSEQIGAIAASMGLPPALTISDDVKRRNYLTVIRRNWHLLPYEQLLELLGWTEEELAFTLREDDFLYVKLGLLKPACQPVYYSPPSPEAQRRAAEIRCIVETEFGDAPHHRGELPFAFLHELASPIPTPKHSNAPTPQTIELRFLYSYFALYGDPLLQPEYDPYPDGYLARLAELGVNGVWLQGVLHKLAHWKLAPELSDDYETRLENLRRLVARAQQRGIGIYLYMNEPRAMPLPFFEKHPHLRGVTANDFVTLCTSAPEVQEFITESLASIFKAVPDLAGVFTITASENLTNCWSHYRGNECPRCGKRSAADVIAEVNQLVAEGVWRSQPNARVMAWDWGWQDEWAEDVINQLPQNVWLMSVSEWRLPIERGGVKSAVGEYSISSVGPGPRATKHWAAARQRGMKTAAKVQINNTWELSAVPYIPALRLVAEHAANLAQTGVNGLMLSWTLGGYPSPNLEIASQYYGDTAPTPLRAMENVARRRFGDIVGVLVMQAWQQFSVAFSEFPYHGSVVYNAPQQVGPANLLYREPTGYRATMVGFPYDDLERWRAVYPPDIFQAQFEKVANAWQKGVKMLQAAHDLEPSPTLAAELRVAEAAYLHFQSVAHQIAFVRARESDWEKCQQILEAEIACARRLFDLVNADSRIGFEASNHYFYTRLDLVEKVVNCRHLLGE